MTPARRSALESCAAAAATLVLCSCRPAATSSATAAAPAPTSATTSPAAPTATERLYENAIFSDFAAGAYDGTVTVGDLMKHGDFGLGAADRLDGELIVLEGRAYQARAGGAAALLPAAGTTPWAEVVFFSPTRRLALDRSASQTDVEGAIDGEVPSPGAIALKLTGTFRLLRIRAIPGPAKPYPALAAAVKTQVVVDLRDVAATLVGFRLPGCVQGWNVPGYHFHALTADRTRGGHVLAYEVERGSVDVARIDEFDLPRSEADPHREDPACPVARR